MNGRACDERVLEALYDPCLEKGSFLIRKVHGERDMMGEKRAAAAHDYGS